MDSNRIEALLNKYWNCETSLEEEQQLRAYFREHHDIPEAWKETAALFQYFDEQQHKSLNDVSFEGQVLSHVREPRRGKVVSLVYNSMRIAAGVAVLVMAVWFVRNELRDPATTASNDTPAELKDTFDDPQLAFEETKKALKMISKSFGQAEDQAKKINLFNEAQQEVQNNHTQGKSEKL